MKGNGNTNYGKHHSKEAIEKIKARRSLQVGNKGPGYKGQIVKICSIGGVR